MKNYSLNFEDSKKFILSYNIDNDKIVAKLANGELYIIPYSEENENTIISKMENQAMYAQTKSLGILDITLAISQPLVLPIAIMNFANNIGWLYGIVLAIVAEGAIYYPSKVIINTIKQRDIKKMNYFLDYKDQLNKNIYKSENMKLGVSKKAIKQIELQKSKNKQPLNINNIDNFSLSDLKILRANIKRINKEECVKEDLMEQKAPVLKKTLENNRK